MVVPTLWRRECPVGVPLQHMSAPDGVVLLGAGRADEGAVVTDSAIVRRWWRVIGSQHLSALRWHRTCGVALHHGVTVDMAEPPAIGGDVIEFWPGARRIDGREMTDDELAAVRRLLEQMASDARDALAGRSTLVVLQR